MLAVEATDWRDHIRHHVLVFSKQHARKKGFGVRRGCRGDDVEPGGLPVALLAVRLLGLDAEVVVLQRARRDTEQLFSLADVVVGSSQQGLLHHRHFHSFCPLGSTAWFSAFGSFSSLQGLCISSHFIAGSICFNAATLILCSIGFC